jgi:hypothetical protein
MDTKLVKKMTGWMSSVFFLLFNLYFTSRRWTVSYHVYQIPRPLIHFG